MTRDNMSKHLVTSGIINYNPGTFDNYIHAPFGVHVIPSLVFLSHIFVYS